MKIGSFQEMLLEYGITDLEPDDKTNRDEMLSKYKYTVIVEGDYMELDNLERWIKVHTGKTDINWLFYGKFGYNYGFAEYFFDEERHALEAAKAIPNIYTIYPHSYPPNHVCKSDGYDKGVDYDPAAKDAILFKPVEI